VLMFPPLFCLNLTWLVEIASPWIFNRLDDLLGLNESASLTSLPTKRGCFSGSFVDKNLLN